MSRSWMSTLGLALGLMATRATADEIPWRPATARPQANFASTLATADRPAITLGRPQPAEPKRQEPSESPASSARPFTILSESPSPSTPARPVIRAQNFEPPSSDGPPPPPPPPTDWFMPNPAGQKHTAKYQGGPEYPIFDASRSWVNDTSDTVGGWFRPAEGRNLFQSDHAFDHMISPVSNPFLFEDPRALTEIRPLLILQDSPSSNTIFNRGNVNYFGVQARVALTERLSIVISKLGWIWMDPEAPSGEFRQADGFSEFWIGPKYTLIRNTDTCTLLALGLTFQIPTGPASVFQNTGDLSLVPYISFGQNFGKTDWGSFNFLNTTGYTFRTDNQRSEAFYSSFHLDYDVANFHKIYPLIEFNWYHYARNGNVRDLSFEGKDMANFGTKGIAGFDELTFAAGLRYKFTEMFQLGAAFEFPLLGQSNRRLDDFRFTFDVIFRY